MGLFPERACSTTCSLYCTLWRVRFCLIAFVVMVTLLVAQYHP